MTIDKNSEHLLWLEFHYSQISASFDDIDYPEAFDKIFCDIKYQQLDEEYENVGEAVKIGYMILNYYNVGLAERCGLSTFWLLDEQSDISWVLVDMESDQIRKEIVYQAGIALNPNILEGELFVMYPEYRNRGLGEEALKGLIAHFNSKCGYFAFKSFPLQKEPIGTKRRANNFREEFNLNALEPNFKVAQKSLNAFYKKCGFKAIKKIPNYFIMNMAPFL